MPDFALFRPAQSCERLACRAVDSQAFRFQGCDRVFRRQGSVREHEAPRQLLNVIGDRVLSGHDIADRPDNPRPSAAVDLYATDAWITPMLHRLEADGRPWADGSRIRAALSAAAIRPTGALRPRARAGR